MGTRVRIACATKVLRVLPLALLAACAHPRVQALTEVVTGTAPHARSALDAPALARCIANNARALSEGALVRERTRSDGSFDVIVTAGHDALTPIASARVRPTASGSSAVIAVPDSMRAPAGVRKRLLEGC